MSTFIPKKGDLFYTEYKPFVQELNDVLNNVRKIVVLKKLTYKEDTTAIFRCDASDDTAVICTFVINHYIPDTVGTKCTILKSKNIFYPVGPEVKEALGLLEGVDDDEILEMKENKINV